MLKYIVWAQVNEKTDKRIFWWRIFMKYEIIHDQCYRGKLELVFQDFQI